MPEVKLLGRCLTVSIVPDEKGGSSMVEFRLKMAKRPDLGSIVRLFPKERPIELEIGEDKITIRPTD